MRGKAQLALAGGIMLAVAAAGSPLAVAQDEADEATRVGPATISPHWSKYDYPDSVPEGVPYHVIEKGDTLWDLAERYLDSPYLWPQIWDQNKYISDAHWIYPGDPLLLPELAIVAERAGEPGAEGTEEEETASAEGMEGAASQLYPLSEESTLFCAGYISPDREDDSLVLAASEMGREKNAFADRDVLYINQGSNAGIRPGDLFATHKVAYEVRHPVTGKKLGHKINVTGRVRVVMVQENSATVVVESACTDMYLGEYLRPYERPTVPLAELTTPPDPFTPPSGKAQGYIVDIGDDQIAGAAGHVVILDMGAGSGVAPGSRLLAFRNPAPALPESRRVLGELAVLAVHDNTSLAKIMYSVDTITQSDRVELR